MHAGVIPQIFDFDVSSVRDTEKTTPAALPKPEKGSSWAMWSDELTTSSRYLEKKGSVTPSLCRLSSVRVGKTMELQHREDADYFGDLIRGMDEAFSWMESVLFERFCLRELKKSKKESINDYISRLRAKARFSKPLCANCNTSYKNDVLVGTIVKNTYTPKLRQLVLEINIVKLKAPFLCPSVTAPKGNRRPGSSNSRLDRPRRDVQPSKKPCYAYGYSHVPCHASCLATGRDATSAMTMISLVPTASPLEQYC
ncbi:unnamed protein product [Lepeophtheirus salmonis]|uniref:(salmon louse) hypothetical protein n=1 Tax=Lepeophtheirus salmonis TaxID=72036 RepID=A0A7R8H001_LEPSM|nr:unnamed protein product [Lepeophtheirus salmonis]CAF2774699.1 unnamed protein product [Lepeophtheirus salmonis]